VSSLAGRLGLSTTVVRRHLDALAEAGYAEAGDRPPYGPTPVRGRGRPARVYALTQRGRDVFDQAYDDLAVSALRYLADSGGRGAVLGFARRRADDLRHRYARRIPQGASEPERIKALALALSDDGYVATAAPAPGPSGGSQLCQHHCPVAHVAAEFPELCEAETEAFGDLLGVHATRLATIGKGDGVCTTLVPSATPTGTTTAGSAVSAHLVRRTSA
jgi:predicted ArsR family transcriptional regulator